MIAWRTGIMLLMLTASAAQAMPQDRIGGPDAAAQTITHCGLLPTTARLYTTWPSTIALVQEKLAMLGYMRDMPSGRYDRASKQAVQRFQRDYGLKPDGVVGPATAQRLAFEAHPSANVRRCFRLAQ